MKYSIILTTYADFLKKTLFQILSFYPAKLKSKLEIISRKYYSLGITFLNNPGNCRTEQFFLIQVLSLYAKNFPNLL